MPFDSSSVAQSIKPVHFLTCLWTELSGTFPIAARSKTGSQRSDRAIPIATDRTCHSSLFFDLDRKGGPPTRYPSQTAQIAATCAAIQARSKLACFIVFLFVRKRKEKRKKKKENKDHPGTECYKHQCVFDTVADRGCKTNAFLPSTL